jgi:hypothetical protein
MTTPQVIATVATLAAIGLYAWLARIISRWAAARYGINETVAGNVFGFIVFVFASFIWIYFDIWNLLESHGIPVKR